MFHNFSKGELSAVDAKSQAQYIAFAPFIFQTTATLRDLNILSCIGDGGKKGVELDDIAISCDVPAYGVQVLLDFAISMGVLKYSEGTYKLSNVGYFLLNDEMTRVNFEFNQHFCYPGLNKLTDSIKTESPSGLKVFGEWETVYQALTSLPEKPQKSWFDFDHFYSDNAFDEALAIVFNEPPKILLDIGGNTGRWATKCLDYDANVQLVIMDLPQQLEVASENIVATGHSDRFTAYPCNMLDSEQALYQGADALWMSQFLDCFAPDEIISILKRCASVMNPGYKLYIMETFIDRQEYNAASFSLNAISLYFTCFANGNSRMYHSEKMLPLIEKAGLKIIEQKDQIGLGHTLIICEV